MANKPIFKKPKARNTKTIDETFHNLTGQEELTRLISIEQLIPNDNPYPLSELEDLIESIKQFGVEQNLVVQPTETNQFVILAGHRRYHAVKAILEADRDGLFDHLGQLYCKVVNERIDPILARLRLHETNLQTRPLLKMTNNEKKAVIHEYMQLLEQAKEQKLEINGKPVKGKTRDLIAEAFGISNRTAQELINTVKEKPKKKQKMTQQEQRFQAIKRPLLHLEKALKGVKYIEGEQAIEIRELCQKILDRCQ